MDEKRAVVAIAYIKGYIDDALRNAKHKRDWQCLDAIDNAVNHAVYDELVAIRDAIYGACIDDEDDKVKDWTGGTVAYVRGGVTTPAGGRD